MRDDIYSPIERRLLTAWLGGRSPSERDLAWLKRRGFEDDCKPLYSRLDAWVGAFAVRDIQRRLPNWAAADDDGVVMARRVDPARRSGRIAGSVRFLFGINWADSAPGFSWPADYHLAWLPGFDRWVLVYSADSPDALGYCDIALGSFAPDVDWRAAVRGLLVADWSRQAAEWSQQPWAYVWNAGNVTEDEALEWRGEAWPEEEGGEEDELGMDGEEGGRSGD